MNGNSQGRIELLAPAGNLEKLKMAVIYGADAVYLGGEEFGLRASAGNFGMDELKEGISFAHSRGKRYM
jgi:putative protease